MNESSKGKCASFLALAAALAIPGLLPQSAYGMYDPKHGRWLQRDPIGVRVDAPRGLLHIMGQYRHGSSLHEYTNSMPSSASDSHGLCASPCFSYGFDYKEYLDVEEPWTPVLTTRGTTDVNESVPPGRCSLDNPANGYYHLRFNISLEVAIYVLKRGHPRYHDYHFKGYDPKWGKERSDDTERDAVIAHERDHAQSWTKGGWPQIVSEIGALDGTRYCSMERCKRVSRCVQEKVQQFMYGTKGFNPFDDSDVTGHMHSFDTEGRCLGGVYDQFPFKGELDLRPCVLDACGASRDPLCGSKPPSPCGP